MLLTQMQHATQRAHCSYRKLIRQAYRRAEAPKINHDIVYDLNAGQKTAPVEPVKSISPEVSVGAVDIFNKNIVMTQFRWPAALGGEEVYLVGSFNGWNEKFRLIQSEETGHFTVTLPLHNNTMYKYKFMVDGEWHCSPIDSIMKDAKGRSNNQISVVASHTLVWDQPKDQKRKIEVLVTGDFTEWTELLRLDWSPKDNQYRLQCCLPPGTHEYQFLVNGEWFTNPSLPVCVNQGGHRCNQAFVTAPDAFYLYYATGWNNASLMIRRKPTPEATNYHDDPATSFNGQNGSTPYNYSAQHSDPEQYEWKEVRLSRTDSRANPSGGCWWSASVPLDLEHIDGQYGWEYYITNGNGVDDRPRNETRTYLCAGPGGYKLQSGEITPFPRVYKPNFMLVADIDGTMIGDGPVHQQSLQQFTNYWENSAALIGCPLVYNTGRSKGSFEGLFKSMNGLLPLPNTLITAVGTKIWHLTSSDGNIGGRCEGTTWVEDLFWSNLLSQGWDLEAVRSAMYSVMSKFNQDMVHCLDNGEEHPHRIVLGVQTRVVDSVIEKLHRKLTQANIQYKIISSGEGDYRYVDVVAFRAGKLQALEYVRNMYGIPADRTIAAGDSGNDILMLEGQNRGIIVGNAQEGLRKWLITQWDDLNKGRLVMCDKECAGGVMEGISRHGFH